MLELAGHHLLDIASGTDEPSISAAHLAGDTGKVIGTDLTEEMLTWAREKARQAYIRDVIDAANICKQGKSLCMRGTTWIAAAAK